MDNILTQLYDVIAARKGADPKESYVASLYAKGTEKIAAKVTEEAAETIIEAIKGDKEKLREESADLLFHLMVLWADQGITPREVLEVLQRRMGTSGHEEKAGRNG